jgi:hypothetical protein
MTISRRWWEPEAQADTNGAEGRARRSFDVGDLMSLAMNGGEFTSSQFAEMLCCAQYERLPTTRLFRRLPARDASVWSGTRRVHG